MQLKVGNIFIKDLQFGPRMKLKIKLSLSIEKNSPGICCKMNTWRVRLEITHR